MLDPEYGFETRERCSQNHMSTSQTLKTVLRDLQTRDWEERLRILEESGRADGTALSKSRIRARN
jgi:hypothetical protein